MLRLGNSRSEIERFRPDVVVDDIAKTKAEED